MSFIENMQDLEEMVLVMKRNGVPHMRIGDIEVTLPEELHEESTEPEAEEPDDLYSDPDLYPDRVVPILERATK